MFLGDCFGPTGHHADRGQEVAQFFTVAVVELDGFAPPEPLGERGGPLGECGIFARRDVVAGPWIAVDRSWAHLVVPSLSMRERMRRNARRCRILAAPSPMSRIAAISGKLSSSR